MPDRTGLAALACRGCRDRAHRGPPNTGTGSAWLGSSPAVGYRSVMGVPLSSVAPQSLRSVPGDAVLWHRGAAALAALALCACTAPRAEGVDDPAQPTAPDTAQATGAVDPPLSDGGDTPRDSDSDAPIGPFRRSVPMVRVDRCWACAIDDVGALFCWGSVRRACAGGPPEALGEVGAGPFQIMVLRPSTGMAVRDDGSVVPWPESGFTSAGLPPFSGHPTAWVDLDRTHWSGQICGVDADGLLTCTWGWEDVPTSGGWRVVSAGNNAACAVHAVSGLTCWGDDTSFGDLPARGADAVDVAMGKLSACIVTSTGTVRCGGTGIVVDTLPAAFPHPVTRVVVDLANACALMDDGSIACWGRDGQDSEALMTAVPTNGPYVDVDVYDAYACAITADGRVDCWGDADPDVLQPPVRP